MKETTNVQTVTDPGVVDMALGHPDPALLPLEMMRRAASNRFSQNDPLILQYGAEKGDSGFREELADFLSRSGGKSAEEKELFVSGGVSQSLDLVCTLFTEPGDIVLVESPTYFLSLRIFADHGLRVRAIPSDEEGMDTEVLETYLNESKTGGKSEGGVPALVYTIPSFQNPRGFCMSSERRKKTAGLAEKYGFYLLADEVYHPLRYRTVILNTQEVQKRGDISFSFSDLTDTDRVISLGSFSKILGPGLRLGWVQAASKTLHSLVTCGQLDSGGGINAFTAAIVKSALRSGEMDRHLGFLRATYGYRLERLAMVLEEGFHEYGTFEVPEGGYFIWLTLSAGLEEDALVEAAKNEKVRVLPGKRCVPSHMYLPDKGPDKEKSRAVRLSFSFNSADRLEEGVKRLCRAAEKLTRPPSP